MTETEWRRIEDQWVQRYEVYMSVNVIVVVLTFITWSQVPVYVRGVLRFIGSWGRKNGRV